MTDNLPAVLADFSPKSRDQLRQMLVDVMYGWPQTFAGARS